MDQDLTKNMPKITLLILILIAVAIFYFVSHPHPKPENFGDNVSAVIKDTPYYLEVAKTYSTRQTGLPHRTQLCSNCGMLFVFDREGKHPFWMKDTKIPLDIIWLNSKFEVVDFVTATETDSIKSFANSQPAMYVIELNANEVFKLNLKKGDTIQLSNITGES